MTETIFGMREPYPVSQGQEMKEVVVRPREDVRQCSFSVQVSTKNSSIRGKALTEPNLS